MLTVIVVPNLVALPHARRVTFHPLQVFLVVYMNVTHTEQPHCVYDKIPCTQKLGGASLFMGRSTKVPRRGWIEMGELGVVFGSFWVVLGRSSPLNCIYLFVGIYFVVRTACGAPVGLSIHLNQP